jgi:hypothetical protein
MTNLSETLDKYLPDIRSIPKSIIAFEPFILRVQYVSYFGFPPPITIPANVRIVIDEIIMTSMMRWKGGATLTAFTQPYMYLSYQNDSNVLISQTFPTDSSVGGVPVTEANSQYISTTQKLQFNRLPFIAESNSKFIFSAPNAVYSASLQADFTCNITINARQIF